MGGTKVAHPEKITFVLITWPPTIKAADNQRQMREFCEKMGIKDAFDVGEGECHQLLGRVLGPGEVVVRRILTTTWKLWVLLHGSWCHRFYYPSYRLLFGLYPCH